MGKTNIHVETKGPEKEKIMDGAGLKREWEPRLRLSFE